MRWIGASNAVLAACATAALAVPAATAAASTTATTAAPAAATEAAGSGWDGGCDSRGGAMRYARYALTVVRDRPSAYWRLGGWEGRRDVVGWGGDGGDLSAGAQVSERPDGAIGCGWDAAVQLSGATQDDVWESHLVAGAAADTSAPGRAHFGIEIWARPDTLDGLSRRIASRETPAGGYLLAARGDALVFSRYADDGSGTRWSTVSAPPLPLHRWSHIVADYDADGVMRLWVDGQLAGQQASDLALPDEPASDDGAGGRFVLGSSGRLWNPADSSTQAWLEWDGGLDEAAYYGPDTTNLAPHEIRQHWRIGNGGGHR